MKHLENLTADKIAAFYRLCKLKRCISYIDMGVNYFNANISKKHHVNVFNKAGGNFEVNIYTLRGNKISMKPIYTVTVK